jgi:hypothetical protein
MTLRRKNILTWFAITLIIIFIYIPLRTGLLEQQFVKLIITSTEKIVISLSSFEKDKKLRDKDLSRFYTLVKDKYPIAVIATADKKNTILKAGKNEKFIKSNSAFDSIIDSFIKNDFNLNKKSDFIIRYYDQSRFYIFPRALTEGRILVVYPYTLSLRLIIQLILEILLISVFSILLTALIAIRKNKKSSGSDKKTIQVSKKFINKNSDKQIKIQTESINFQFEEKKIKLKESEKPEIDLDSLNSYVFDLFSYISKEYKTESTSLFLINKDSSRMDKIFELKGNAFIKISNAEFNSVSLSPEILEELENSSIMLLEKGRKVTIPINYRNALLGMINITRDKEFKGPEINNIAERIKTIAKQLSENILLSEIRADKAI